MNLPDGWDWSHPDYTAIYAERVERIRRMREKPEIVEGLKAYYAERPVSFINDWCMTVDPRNVERGIEAITPFILFPKQREFIEWLHDRWRKRESAVVEKSRDAGASWLCVAFGVWMWLFHPGVVVGYGSRKEVYVDDLGNPASLFWKARKTIELLPPELRPDGFDSQKHAPHMRILNPENASALVGEAGSNLGRGNRTSLYFVDEAAFLERPEIVDAALSQTTNCRIDVSTPNGEGNPFWRKRMGGKVPVFIFDWRDDPRKGPDWYERQKSTLDPIVLAQEVDRDYGASVGNSFIPSDSVTVAMSKGPADVAPMGPLRVGLDVARFGDDKTVLVFRRGRVDLRISSWGKTDLMSTAGRVKQEVNAFCAARGTHLEQIAVDSTGLGAGVADALRGWFPEGVVVDVDSARRMDDGAHYNLRAFAWSQMRTWMESAAMPNDQDLRADLTSLRYSYRGGLLLLESKDDAKKRGVKSPDRADALAYTFAIPGGAKATKKIPASAVRTVGVDDYVGM